MRKHFVREKRDIQSQHLSLMAALAEYDPDPVLRFNDLGIVIMINQAASELYFGNYMIGKKLYELIPELVETDFESLIREGNFLNITSRLQARIYNFIVRGIPELNIGQIYGNDVTELHGALDKAQESDRIKSHFLSQMSHEIRTPINAIMGFNSIIKDNATTIMNDELDYSFKAIEMSCDKLVRTIDELLDMSQLQSESYKLEPEEINLNTLVSSIAEDFRKEAENKSLTIHILDELEEHIIETDFYSVKQILNCLVDNAIKFTDKGKIEIRLYKSPEGKKAISVSDTGIGIAPDYLRNIFTQFSQQQMGYNRQYEGKGLGLAMSKKFAELNNIEIVVSSKQNSGSSFTIMFN